MICKKCGEFIPDDSIFCPKCGVNCAPIPQAENAASKSQDKQLSQTENAVSQSQAEQSPPTQNAVSQPQDEQFMKCESCGERIPVGSYYCPNCWANCHPTPPSRNAVSQSQRQSSYSQNSKPKKLYCPNCGAQIHEQSQSCSYCGMKFKTGNPQKNEKTSVPFIGIMGIVYFIVLAIVVLCLFGSENCVCYAGDLYYTDQAVQTFMGTFIVSTIILAVANIIYQNTKNKK